MNSNKYWQLYINIMYGQLPATEYRVCQLAFRSGDVIRLSMKIAAKGTKLAEDHSKKVCVGEY